MSELRWNDAGDAVFWDRRTGDWIPATEEMKKVARTPLGGKVLSAVQGATGIPGLIDPELGEAAERLNPNTAGVAFGASMLSGVGGRASRSPWCSNKTGWRYSLSY